MTGADGLGTEELLLGHYLGVSLRQSFASQGSEGDSVTCLHPWNVEADGN